MNFLICVPNKLKYLNLTMLHMITGINESKRLTKHLPCEVNVNIDLMEENVIQINGGIMINVDVSVKTSCMWTRLCLEFC